MRPSATAAAGRDGCLPGLRRVYAQVAATARDKVGDGATAKEEQRI